MKNERLSHLRSATHAAITVVVVLIFEMSLTAAALHRVADPVRAHAPGGRDVVGAATIDEVTLVVWREWRDLDTPGNLAFRRITTSTAEPLDAEPVVLSMPGQLVSEDATVAENGAEFLIAWSNTREIIGALLTPRGAIKHLGVIALGTQPSVAANDRGWVIVSHHDGLQAEFLTRDGSPLGRKSIGGHRTDIAVVSDGDSYLVASLRRGEIYLSVFDEYGVKVTRLLGPGEGSRLYSFSLTFSNGRYLLAMLRYVDTPPLQFQVQLHQLDSAAVSIGEPIEVTSPFRWEVQPRIVDVGTNALLLFHGTEGNDEARIAGVPVGSRGELGETKIVSEPMSHSVFHAAGANGNAIIARAVRLALQPHSDSSFSRSLSRTDIFVNSVDQTLEQRGQEQYVSEGVPAHSEPSATWLRDTLFVAWSESRTASLARAIHVGRIDSGGNRIDGAGKPVSPSTADQKFAAVQSGTSNILLAWLEQDLGSDRGSVRVALLNENAAITATATLDDNAAVGPPTVAWDGTEYVVAWQTRKNDIVAARVRATGEVRDVVPRLLTPPLEPATEPQLRRTRTGFILVWRGRQPYSCPFLCPSFDWNVRAAIVSRDLIPAPAVTVAPIFSGPPSVAVVGDIAVIAFRGSSGIVARRYDLRTGTFLDDEKGILLLGAAQGPIYQGGRRFHLAVVRGELNVAWLAGVHDLGRGRFDADLRPLEFRRVARFQVQSEGTVTLVPGMRLATLFDMPDVDPPSWGARRVFVIFNDSSRVRSVRRE